MPAAPSTGKAIVLYRTRLIIGLSLLLSTALCPVRWHGFPGVYLINIDQGNIVEQDMVDQLKPDMTRRQVRFLLGTLLLKIRSITTDGITFASSDAATTRCCVDASPLYLRTTFW